MRRQIDYRLARRAVLREWRLGKIYVYGDALKAANGRCITSPVELERLGEVCEEFACYVVEVCTECSWNHLIRSYLLGRRHAV
jgi:hypothetical protein